MPDHGLFISCYFITIQSKKLTEPSRLNSLINKYQHTLHSKGHAAEMHFSCSWPNKIRDICYDGFEETQLW